jgi:hypothetical protein
MSASIVSFIRRAVNRDWAAQELAEFYRVEAALVQSGMRVTSDRGVTDEGDPWFVFCRAEDEEVLIHFARIDGRYLISAPGYGGNVTGHNFNALVRDLVDRQPVLQTPRPRGNVVLHPSALLVMLVATILLKSGHAAEAAAAKMQDGHAGATDRGLSQADLVLIDHAVANLSIGAQESAAMLSAAVFAAAMYDDTSLPTMVISAPPPPQPEGAFQPASLLAPPADDGSGHFVAGQGSSTPEAQALPAVATTSANQAPHDSGSASWHQAAQGGASGPGVWIESGAASPDSGLRAVPLPPTGPTDAITAAISLGDAPIGSHDLAESLLKAFAGQQPIIHTDVIPEALTAPLQQSAHTVAGSTPALAPHTVAPPAEMPVTEAATAAVAPSPATTPSTPVVTTPPTQAETAQPVQTVTATPQIWPDLNTVLATMQTFAKEVGSHLAVLVTGNQVIEYDYYAVDHNPASVSAVTYDFADGSHLSLVGLPSELPHSTV